MAHTIYIHAGILKHPYIEYTHTSPLSQDRMIFCKARIPSYIMEGYSLLEFCLIFCYFTKATTVLCDNKNLSH